MRFGLLLLEPARKTATLDILFRHKLCELDPINHTICTNVNTTAYVAHDVCNETVNHDPM